MTNIIHTERIGMNKCPDKYRGLTPARECRLRSIRLGVEETPGRLPMSADEKRVALDRIHEAQLKLTERVKLLRKARE